MNRRKISDTDIDGTNGEWRTGGSFIQRFVGSRARFIARLLRAFGQSSDGRIRISGALV